MSLYDDSFRLIRQCCRIRNRPISELTYPSSHLMPVLINAPVGLSAIHESKARPAMIDNNTVSRTTAPFLHRAASTTRSISACRVVRKLFGIERSTDGAILPASCLRLRVVLSRTAEAYVSATTSLATTHISRRTRRWVEYAHYAFLQMIERFNLGDHHVVGSCQRRILAAILAAKGIPCLGVEPAANVADVAVRGRLPSDSSE